MNPRAPFFTPPLAKHLGKARQRGTVPSVEDSVGHRAADALWYHLRASGSGRTPHSDAFPDLPGPAWFPAWPGEPLATGLATPHEGEGSACCASDCPLIPASTVTPSTKPQSPKPEWGKPTALLPAQGQAGSSSGLGGCSEGGIWKAAGCPLRDEGWRSRRPQGCQGQGEARVRAGLHGDVSCATPCPKGARGDEDGTR